MEALNRLISPLDPERLEFPVTTKSATDLARDLGRLRGFLLNDVTLTLANPSGCGGRRPELPGEPGSCWPVIAVRQDQWTRFLSPAFPLPVCWRESAAHDRHLPPDLIACADQVRMAGQSKEAAQFHLHYPAPDHGWPDLSQFGKPYFSANSAFASLALGLRSAITGVKPSKRTWASASWDGNQFVAVDLLDQKLEAARRWGVETFYVAANLVPTNSQSSPRLVALKETTHHAPSEALADYFSEGLVEPESDDWESCRRYHAAIRQTDRERAVRFYNQKLFRLITHRCRESIRRGVGGEAARPTAMITIVTPNPEPIRVLLGITQATRVLLLHTERDGMEGVCNELANQIKSTLPGCQPTPAAFRDDIDAANFPTEFVHSLQSAIAKFTADLDESEIVFDIDRGTTLQKLALWKHVIRPHNWLTTLHHKWTAGRNVEHGTEQVMLWRADDSWSQPFTRSPSE